MRTVTLVDAAQLLSVVTAEPVCANCMLSFDSLDVNYLNLAVK